MHTNYGWGNYQEPDDLTSRLRTAFTLQKWKTLREKLGQIDSSSSGTECESYSDRCSNLRSTNQRIENEYVYSALNSHDENAEDCICDSEESLVTNMTRKVDEIIGRISEEEDCGGCGTCGECTTQDIMKESEVQRHE